MFINNKKHSLSREERRRLIFSIIIDLTNELGLFSISLKAIAKRGKCSVSLVKSYFGGIKEIRQIVIRHAAEHNIEKILKTPIQDYLKS